MRAHRISTCSGIVCGLPHVLLAASLLLLAIPIAVARADTASAEALLMPDALRGSISQPAATNSEQATTPEGRLPPDAATAADTGIGSARTAAPSATHRSASTPGHCFTVASIKVLGATLLPAPILRTLLAEWTGRCLDARAIGNLAAAVERLYAESGISGVRCLVPRQSIGDGTLQLVVVENPAALAAMQARRSSTAPAVPVASRPSPSPACLPVRHIEVTGSSLLPMREKMAIARRYAGKCLTPADITRLNEEITALHVRAGYITTRSYIPPQSLADGRLRLRIVDGVVERIVYREKRGATSSDGPRSMVLSSFPVGITGGVLYISDLEQALAQINRVPSSTATVNIRPGNNPGGSVLEIVNEIDDAWRLYANLEHSSQKDVTTNTASLTLEVDNLLRINDTLRLSVSGNRGSSGVSGAFSFPFGYWTFILNGNYSSELSQLSSTVDYYNQTSSVSASVKRQLLRREDALLDVLFSFTNKWRERYMNATRLLPQKLTIAGLAVSAQLTFSPDIQAYISSQLDVGLPILGATPDVADPTSPKSRYLRTTMDAQLYARLSSAVLYSWNLHAQVANAVLYSSEQLTLGGASAVRGFGSVASAGETGYYVRNELLFSPTAVMNASDWQTPAGKEIWRALKGLEPFVFIDMGVARDKAARRTYGMISGGAGLRWNHRGFSLSLSIARPLARSATVPRPSPYELQFSVGYKVF